MFSIEVHIIFSLRKRILRKLHVRLYHATAAVMMKLLRNGYEYKGLADEVNDLVALTILGKPVALRESIKLSSRSSRNPWSKGVFWDELRSLSWGGP